MIIEKLKVYSNWNKLFVSSLCLLFLILVIQESNFLLEDIKEKWFLNFFDNSFVRVYSSYLDTLSTVMYLIVNFILAIQFYATMTNIKRHNKILWFLIMLFLGPLPIIILNGLKYLKNENN